MKKFFVFLISLASLFDGYSQDLEKTFRIQFESGINKILSDGQSGWFLGGFYKRFDQPSSPPWISRVDSIGHLLWTNTVMQSGLEEGEVGTFTGTEDYGIAAIGRLLSCDAGPDASFVRKIDENGNTLWTYIWSESMNPVSGRFNSVVESIDNGILVSRDSLILKLSSAGDSLWTRTPAFGWINSMASLPSGDLILGSSEGLARIDSIGFLQFSRPFAFPVRKTKMDPVSRINCISNNILFRLDPFLGMIDSIALNNWFTQVRDFQVDTGRIWIIGNAIQGNSDWVLTLDENFNFISFNQTGYLGSRSVSIAFNQNQIIHAGWQQELSSKTAYIKTADRNGNSNNGATDISLSSISIANYFLVPVSPLLPNLVDVYMDIDVSVINNGQDTIRSLFLNAEMNFAFLCFKALQYKEFSGLSILPGDTALIRMNGLRDYAREYNDPFAFKIWTSDPNRKMDQDISNDSLSVLYFFSGIKKNPVNPFTISPNPSKEEFRISSSKQDFVQEIRLYSLNGSIVLSKKTGYESSVLINWPDQTMPGMYILEIVSDKGIFRSKIVKQ